MLLTEAHNIFRGVPLDYNVRVMNCKRADSNSFEVRVAKVIFECTGINVFDNIKYRGREYVQARNIFIVLVKAHTNYSQALTTSYVGKDHATYYNAQKYCNNIYKTEKAFRELFDRIETKVKLLK